MGFFQKKNGSSSPMSRALRGGAGRMKVLSASCSPVACPPRAEPTLARGPTAASRSAQDRLWWAHVRQRRELRHGALPAPSQVSGLYPSLHQPLSAMTASSRPVPWAMLIFRVVEHTA